MDVTASSAAQLNAALKSAQAGDVITLAAGTYAGVQARDLSFAADVVIRSHQDAVITSLNISGSRGLTFQDLTFRADARAGKIRSG